MRHLRREPARPREQHEAEYCWTRPTTAAATAVPRIEPRPPITTTMNAKIRSDVPRAGSTVPK
jgi:hypothetical protein